MYIDGKWYSETEAQAYIRKISEQVDELKALLKQVRAYYGELESWVDLYEEKYKELVEKEGKNG